MSNPIIEATASRRSCCAFKSDSVPRELLEEVAEAGLGAANGMGKQATKIIIVTDKSLRNRIAEQNCIIGG